MSFKVNGDAMEIFDFYAQRLERAHDYGMLLEPTGRILYANRGWRMAHGLRAGDDPGTIYDGMQQDEAEWVRLAMADMRNGPPMQEKNITVRTRDGNGVRQVQWRGVEIFIPDHDKSFILALGRSVEPVDGAGPQMGFTIRPDGSILSVSRRLCKLCGYSTAEVLAMSTHEFYYDAVEHGRILHALTEDKIIERGEVTLRHRDGSPVNLLFCARGLRDCRGTVQAFGGYFRLPPPMAGHGLQERFAPIVDALPDAAWVVGRDHRIVAVNDSYLRTFSLQKESVLGHSENEMFPDATAEALVQAANRVFEKRSEILSPMVQHFTENNQWVRIIRRPVFDVSERRLVGLLGICQDITAPANRESAFMNSIAEDESDAVLVINNQGQLIRRNDTLFSPSILGEIKAVEGHIPELTGMLDVLHPEDVTKAQRCMRNVLVGKGEQRFECRVRNAYGRYVLAGIHAYYNEEFFNEPRMYVVARDLSRTEKLRRAEYVLERLKKATGSRTNRELAAFLNVSPASVSNAKRQRRVPPDWLVSVGRDTGASIDWLFTGLGSEWR